MVKHVRQAAEKYGRECKVVMDLPGPKCRVATLWPKKPDRLHVGDCFQLAVSAGGKNDVRMPVITVSFPEIVARLPLQAQVWIDDGKIRGRVVGVEGSDCIVEVVGAADKPARGSSAKGQFPRQARLPAFSSH